MSSLPLRRGVPGRCRSSASNSALPRLGNTGCQQSPPSILKGPPVSNSTASRQPARVVSTTTADDAGRLVLRLAIGLLILLHGVAKLRTGVDSIAGMLAQQGLPGSFAYLVYIGEVAAPLLVIIGVWTRPAALVIALNMVVALLLAHSAEVFKLGDQGGWAIELQALYLFGAVAIALLGAGRLSAGGTASIGRNPGGIGRWN